MELQRIRLFLLIALFAIGMSLYSAWQQEHPPAETVVTTLPAKGESDIPSVQVVPNSAIMPIQQTTVIRQEIEVTTDVLKVKIDPLGGDIVRAELIKYPQTLDPLSSGVVFLDHSEMRNFVAQSGLIGKNELGPDSRTLGRALYEVVQTTYHLGDQSSLKVDLHWKNENGLQVIKSLIFKKGSYLIEVQYQITNATPSVWLGSFYGQIRREFVKEASSSFLMGVQMYQGGALYTPNKPFKKISFPDMQKAAYKEQIEGGWAALLERYFLCAFIPKTEAINHYYTRVDESNVYNIGETTAVEVAPHATGSIKGEFYIGPEAADVLKTISPGLNLTVDYGILWPISQVLFWLLKTINEFIGNWGWSIILVTLVIKILFYPLSSASYRSMGNMRRLQPRIELLKERHKEDKQQFSAALMELYRKEKLNPLGGCLPILIQIPVFIALYYVLLESVELRHAPFMFWIKDLSAKDPFYILPLIMGATMFLQQKMNPAPPDPMQAKVMMFMPVIFTALFLNFPSGLVLYWTANNILSMGQQWYIMRQMQQPKTALQKVK